MKRRVSVAIAALLVWLAPMACSTGRVPVYVTNAGNCRVLFDADSEEYAQYIASARRATGCRSSKLADCTPQINLRLTAYPTHISRDKFENPNWKARDFAHVRLRTTSLVGYDLWLSQYFSPEPWAQWGYDIQFRDRAGKVLRSTIAAGKRDLPDCSNYVVLSRGNSVDIDIPLSGQYLEKLEGNELNVRIVYVVGSVGAPKAIGGTVPIFGTAVSNTITIAVE